MIDTIAIYIRLSLEDDDLCSGCKTESESTTNQRKMLTAHIRNSPVLCGAEIMEFCDDGYSGKNFDRPGFKALIQSAQRGEIQCVVVKDLSRFGRDYITVGNYISKVFPFLGVRFIAVNDHFDSARKGDIDSLDTSFKTLIYDLYSRDLSQKVKSAKRQLVERGVYINPVPPFGYRKDPQDRHRLLIDPAAAEIVKQIFSMAAANRSTREIARALNAAHAPTPSKQKRGTSGEHANWPENNFWTQRMISEIIRDRQYAGSLVWGKRVRNQIGVHRQLTTHPEDRTVLDGHHEGIVTMEQYEKAHAVLGGAYQNDAPHVRREYPLRGKVRCGVCGRAIIRTAGKVPYYRCDTPTTLPEMDCFREKIDEEELLEMVAEAIRAHAACAVDAGKMLQVKREQEKMRVRELQAELEQTEIQRGQLAEQGRRLYEKLVDAALTRKAYAGEKRALLRRMEESENRAEDLRRQISTASAKENPFVAHFSPYTELDVLTSAIVDELVDRVTIGPDGALDIRLNFADELLALPAEEFREAV